MHKIIHKYQLSFCLVAFLLFFTRSGQAQETPRIITKKTIATHEDSLKLQQLITEIATLLLTDLDSAKVLLSKAYTLSAQTPNRYKLAEILALRASYYSNIGDFKKSDEFIAQANTIAQQSKDFKLAIYIQNTAGLSLIQTGNYEEAMLHFLHAKRIMEARKLQGTAQAVEIYNNLAIIWLKFREYEQALNMLALARKNQNDSSAASSSLTPYIIQNMGLAYINTNRDLAIMNFNSSLDHLRKQKQPDIYAEYRILFNIGYLNLETGDFKNAYKYLQEAKQVAKNLGSQTADAYAEISDALYYLYTKQYNKALPIFNKIIAQAQLSGNIELMINSYLSAAQIYAALGNYREAYVNQQLYIAHSDSLQGKAKGKTVDLVLKYAAMEKDKEITQQQLKLLQKDSLLKSKNIWIGITLTALLLLLLIWNQTRRVYKSKQQLQQERLLTMGQQQEIEKLKAMVEGEEKERRRIAYDLHDGIMASFALVKMKLNKLPEQPDTYTHVLKHFDQATSELRRTAHNLMPDMLLEEGLVQAIFYYCKTIEENAGLKIHFQQQGPIPRFIIGFEVALYRIIQELIHNTIKHAHADHIIVQLGYGDGLLSLTLEDDGQGFKNDESFEGRGLMGIKNRVNIYGGSFDIQGEPGVGTTVFLEFDETRLSPPESV